jgi:hypothetical protein
MESNALSAAEERPMWNIPGTLNGVASESSLGFTIFGNGQWTEMFQAMGLFDRQTPQKSFGGKFGRLSRRRRATTTTTTTTD